MQTQLQLTQSQRAATSTTPPAKQKITVVFHAPGRQQYTYTLEASAEQAANATKRMQSQGIKPNSSQALAAYLAAGAAPHSFNGVPALNIELPHRGEKLFQHYEHGQAVGEVVRVPMTRTPTWLQYVDRALGR